MLKGPELGAALTRAMALKGVRNADIARQFGIKPPSVIDWKKYGRIGKEHLEPLFAYFSDVVGPEHWGLPESSPFLARVGRRLMVVTPPEPSAPKSPLKNGEDVAAWLRTLSPKQRQTYTLIRSLLGTLPDHACETIDSIISAASAQPEAIKPPAKTRLAR